MTTWLKKSEFVPYAPDTVGAQVQLNHADCPSGIDRKQRLYVKRTVNGVVAYCHHCGKKGAAFQHSGEAVWHSLEHAPVSREAVREAKELLKYEDALRWVEYYNAMPQPIKEGSDDAQEWLSSKGFSLSTAQAKWGAPEGERPGLVLPIRAAGGRVVGVQVRRLFTKNERAQKMYGPKYETKLVEKTEPYIYGDSSVVAFVEDYLSAQRLSKIIAAVPLYGSTLSDSALLHVVRQKKFRNAVVWLDNDRDNIKQASLDMARQIAPLINVMVVTEKDEPTRYIDSELEKIVGWLRC